MSKIGVRSRKPQADRTLIALFLGLLALGLGGCHGVEVGDLPEAMISPADKFLDVAHVSGDTFVIVGYKGKVLRTTDAGRTWEEVPRPTGWTLTDVEFSGEYGWAVGQNGTILHSRDSGQTWTPQTSGTDVLLMAISVNSDRLHGWVTGDYSTVISTNNGGETWNAKRIDVSQVGLTEDMALAIPDVIYYDVFFLDDNKTGWLVGEYGQIRSTHDGGKTWGDQHGSILETMKFKEVLSLPALFRIRFWDSQNGLAVGAGGDILGTKDGGETWRYIAKEGTQGAMALKGEPNLAEEVPNSHLYSLVIGPSRNGRQVVAVGAGGVVIHSSSETEKWQPSKLAADTYTWINGLDINESGKGVLVGGKGLILRTEDRGETWLTVGREAAT
jgi:photosystem II stability/assembly factor-like uncharacterized protein